MRTAPKARQPKFPMMIDLTGHEDGNSQGILATTLGYDRLLGFLAVGRPLQLQLSNKVGGVPKLSSLAKNLVISKKIHNFNLIKLIF